MISLKTRSDELFELACKELNLDVISFHFDERLSFELNPLLIKRAMERRVYFEISYAPTIKGILFVWEEISIDFFFLLLFL